MPTEEYLENRRKYLENRGRFPPDALVRFAGQWIAWSPDGARVVANAADLDLLDELVRRAGEDAAQCVVEAIPAFDSVVGAGVIVPEA